MGCTSASNVFKQQTGSIQSILLLSALIYMIRIDAHWCFGASSIPSSIVTSSSTYSSTYSSTPIAYVGLSHFAYPRSGTSTMRDLEQRLPVQCHIPRQFSSDSSDSSDSSVTGLLDIDHIWSSRISSQTEHRHQAVCSESFLFAGSLWLTQHASWSIFRSTF